MGARIQLRKEVKDLCDFVAFLCILHIVCMNGFSVLLSLEETVCSFIGSDSSDGNACFRKKKTTHKSSMYIASINK